MKVRELIAALERHDPEAEVHLSYNYGDHWRTRVAPAVRGVEDATITHSEYHSMDRIHDPEDEREPKDARDVVVLR